MSAPLAAACTGTAVRDWSHQFLAVVDQGWPGETGSALHKAWFRTTGSDAVKRRGYCLGFHVVALLARTHTLREMAGWDEPTYLPAVRAALHRLEGSPCSAARLQQLQEGCGQSKGAGG